MLIRAIKLPLPGRERGGERVALEESTAARFLHTLAELVEGTKGVQDRSFSRLRTCVSRCGTKDEKTKVGHNASLIQTSSD
ncbi:MAG: hypothetical protein ABS69_11550 [Nitrosomonadales bacterium SCN 54-20]|nr:MAG: hypothetical protein ABS69_11550 [Nitrosomonadales bacterium SCN 54-20]